MEFSACRCLLFYVKIYLCGGYGMEFKVFVVTFLTVVNFLPGYLMLFPNRAEVTSRVHIARSLKQTYQNL